MYISRGLSILCAVTALSLALATNADEARKETGRIGELLSALLNEDLSLATGACKGSPPAAFPLTDEEICGRKTVRDLLALSAGLSCMGSGAEGYVSQLAALIEQRKEMRAKIHAELVAIPKAKVEEGL